MGTFNMPNHPFKYNGKWVQKVCINVTSDNYSFGWDNYSESNGSRTYKSNISDSLYTTGSGGMQNKGTFSPYDYGKSAGATWLVGSNGGTTGTWSYGSPFVHEYNRYTWEIQPYSNTPNQSCWQNNSSHTYGGTRQVWGNNFWAEGGRVLSPNAFNQTNGGFEVWYGSSLNVGTNDYYIDELVTWQGSTGFAPYFMYMGHMKGSVEAHARATSTSQLHNWNQYPAPEIVPNNTWGETHKILSTGNNMLTGLSHAWLYYPSVGHYVSVLKTNAFFVNATFTGSIYIGSLWQNSTNINKAQRIWLGAKPMYLYSNSWAKSTGGSKIKSR